ncbi:MAG: hypothetical protein MI702_07645, partial [Chlorobiales bacterium]|nr:hypothetical protein [Chlorobiales bacterium]
DIESYNELEEDDPDSHRIYMVWADGYEDDNNGSQLGRVEDPLASPFTSHSLRRNGGQAMSLLYDNTVAEKSEVKAQIADLDNVNPDWTQNDATILTVWVYGAVGNTGSLYVTINGVKVADSAGTVDLAQPQWQPFIIDTAAVGTDTTVVMEIGIGIEGAAAKGNIYVDDIALGLP